MFATGSFLYSEELIEEMIEMLQDTAVLKWMLFYCVIMFLICFVSCFFIARSAKLPKTYTLFGFLGMSGVMIVICRSIAKSKGLSPYFMWLGLLEIYGVFLLMIISYFSVKKKTSQDSTYQSEWEKQYEAGKKEREEQKRGYNLNGEYHEYDRGTICLNCGAAVGPGEKICPRCKNQVR